MEDNTEIIVYVLISVLTIIGILALKIRSLRDDVKRLEADLSKERKRNIDIADVEKYCSDTINQADKEAKSIKQTALMEIEGQSNLAIARARGEASDIVNKAKKDANNILESAKKPLSQSHFIVDEARREASDIVNKAKKDARIILQSAENQLSQSNLDVVRARGEASYIVNKATKDANNILESAEDKAAKILRFADKKQELLDHSISNLTALPYMAKLVAEYETYDIELLAKSLDWGSNIERAKKVASIRQIRTETQQMIERYKLAEYQLEYIKNLYPVLEEVLETEYVDLPKTDLSDLPDRDPTKEYLSKEEWAQLSVSERNQLALDRYIEGHRKTKWQIGRDYELYIGYIYECKGYTIDYFGSYMGMEDLGRDLIAKKNGETLVVQCKYWSAQKVIREKHIAQLYGTTMCYCMEHALPREKVTAVFCTNITISEQGKAFAEYLGVELHDNIPLGEFPRIKCNIGKDEYGTPTHIYHLPFDQQYDKVKIDSPGECFAFTVKEAEEKGFRRAYKWYGD